MEKRHQYPLGIIGNCSYISYIDNKANIVWHCWPYFDSDFVFGKLLDDDGGEFSIAPAEDDFESTQSYIENTNVLQTEFHCKHGAFRVIDFAPRFKLYERSFRPLLLMRKIEIIRGTPLIKVKFDPRGNYGKTKPTSVLGSNHISYRGLRDELRITSNISKPYILEQRAFTLTETKYIAFYQGDRFESPLESTAEDFLQKTINYWQTWVEGTAIPAIYQYDVIRSALVLKLHQYEDTGAIIASGTTSLPESPNSGRNWDYRYCWIRDSYYTLQAFRCIGQFSEMKAYSHYIQDIVQRFDGQIAPVYSIRGEEKLEEVILDLAGYLNNKPVRFGNEAYKQVQYDVYGQILLSLLPLYVDVRLQLTTRPPYMLIDKILRKIAEVIDLPDAGIWEFRGRKRKHGHTYLFHWAGSSAAMKIAKIANDQAMYQLAESLNKKAIEYIEKCYRPTEKYYASNIDSDDVDASDFLYITMNYLAYDSQRAKDHLSYLEEKLSAGNGLIYRYRHEDDFGPPETAFLICGFWYAEALACVGRVQDAIAVFEKLKTYGNSLGLLSEDVCPQNFAQWGNLPQTYSHVGLINCVARIASKRDSPLFVP